ncbi:MAG TPA: hypothetical protein VJH22_07440 [Candidatus Nanoarchaeia archaeon]|nr:hypothetical protein [Candidatus Nanoarchaeia archaeon]
MGGIIMGRRAKEEPKSRFAESIESIKQSIASNTERIRDIQQSAEEKMSEHPLQTALVAFGVGIVCGVGLKMLIESKRR